MSSGSTAKQGRREQQLRELVAQAHDRLHKQDVEGCHELLHQALGAGYYEPAAGDPAPLRTGLHERFDQQFARLCRNLGVRAAYVALEPPSRLLGGGDAKLDAFLAGAVRAALEAVQRVGVAAGLEQAERRV